MTDLNQPSPNISLDLPFADQDAVQALLGYPAINPESIAASPELLYKIIDVVHQWLKENQGLSEDLPGMKIGFERKVLVDSEKENYRIESQFISNSSWRSEYDLDIVGKRLVSFLVDPREEENPGLMENSEVDTSPLNSIDISYGLADRISEEVDRLYPKLKECIEIHVYVFWNITPKREVGILRPMSLLSETQAQSSCPCDDTNGRSWRKSKNIDGLCKIEGC